LNFDAQPPLNVKDLNDYVL